MQTDAKLLLAEKKARNRLRAAATLLILTPSRYRRADFSESVILARATSARAGIEAANAQLTKLGIEASESVTGLPVLTEAYRADEVASGYIRWFEETKPTEAEIVRARIDRIAATENARAFNEGLLEEAKATSREQNIVLYRTWSAEGDACPICSENDGKRALIHESYPNGEEPGSVHPNCRCTEEFSK